MLARQTEAADAQALEQLRHHAGGAEAALHLAGIGDADALEGEDLLQVHLLVPHAEHFGDAQDLAGAVLQARHLHHQLDGAGELLQNHARGNLEVGHHHHGFEARERVARRVGVDRAHRALDAGVHRLQHVERFGAAALADDDAVGPHTERGAQQHAAG